MGPPDRALGMDARIARADFLDGRPHTMMAKDHWDGYGGAGDYASANGNMHSDLSGIMDHRASIAESDRAVNQLNHG